MSSVLGKKVFIVLRLLIALLTYIVYMHKIVSPRSVFRETVEGRIWE
jgi:hypothetical protein